MSSSQARGRSRLAAAPAQFHHGWAQQVAPNGQAVAVDIDLSLVEMRVPNLKLLKGNILAGPIEPAASIS